MSNTDPLPSPKPRRRGIYLLPNLFTTAALCCGFYAIIVADNQRYEAAALAIFLAMVLDSLDGRIARLTHTQSEFGVQYDSLADLVSFGVAPALVMYQWSLIGLGRYGGAVAFLYTLTAALRLARFNTQVSTADKAYFQGLPSPAAAGLLAGLLWAGQDYALNSEILRWLAVCLTILAGLLMVSNIRYRSFKDLHFDKVPFFRLLAIVPIFILLFLEPAAILFGLFLAYAASGPLLTVQEIRRRRANRKSGKNNPEAAGGG